MKPKIATALKDNHIDPEPTRSPSSKSTTFCTHCGRAVEPSEPIIAAFDAVFCCHGCRTVYNILKAEGYSRYYEILAQTGAHAPSMDTSADILRLEFDDPEIWRVPGSRDIFALHIPDISCAACIWLLEGSLTKFHRLSDVRVNLEDRKLSFRIPESEPTRIVLAAILKRLKTYGYIPIPTSHQKPSQHMRQSLIRIGVGAAAFGNVMLFATAIYFGDAWGIDPSMAKFFLWWSFVISTLSLMGPGRLFFQHALGSLRTLTLHIDLPIALALTVAWLASAHSLFFAGRLFYFDSITGLVFLLLLGRHVKDQMTERANNLTHTFTSLLPPSSRSLKVGDQVEVRVGEAFPCDGRIIAGSTEVDESALTGESVALLKTPGSQVVGGSRNLSCVVSVEVECAFEDSIVRQLERRIKEASFDRSAASTLAGKILPWFILVTLTITALGGLYWWPQNPRTAVEVMCAILVVCCPCALALATPIGISMALKRAWQHGAIIKNAECLEKARAIKVIALDKTGTLTIGRPQVYATQVLNACRLKVSDLQLIHSILFKSLHPVARGVATWCQQPSNIILETHDANHFADIAPVESIAEVAGHGLKASSASYELFAGKATWIAAMLPESAEILRKEPSSSPSVSECVVAVKYAEAVSRPSRLVLVRFLLRDSLHPHSEQVIRRWSKHYDVWLLSGDSQSAAAATGELVGMRHDRILGGMSPDDKYAFIRDIESQGLRVLMVGDGVNDAAALKTATLGVAVKGGVDLALNAADAFLTRPGVAPVEDLLRYATYVRHTLVIIMIVSISYNLIAVILALQNILHPAIAAAIMPLASLSVLSIAKLRKGEHSWKSSMLSCPLPSPSQVRPS